MNGLSKKYAVICQEISTGMKEGGYDALKKAYPHYWEKVNQELDDNFNLQQMNKYRDTIITGLKKIGYWEGQT